MTTDKVKVNATISWEFPKEHEGIALYLIDELARLNGSIKHLSDRRVQTLKLLDEQGCFLHLNKTRPEVDTFVEATDEQ